MPKPHLENQAALTQERLKAMFHYNAKTGLFTRLIGVKGSAAGEIAGCPSKLGYIRITVDYRQYQAHRLAWFYMTGKWPLNEVDHSDGDPSNNRWTNLRECTHAENHQNHAVRADNKSGHPGVSRFRRKWQAHIAVNGVIHHIGHFDDPAEAGRAYLEAKARLHTFNPTVRGLSASTETG